MSEPDMESLRIGVLLPFSTKSDDRISELVRRGLSAIRLAVNEVGGVIGDIRSDLTRYEALMTSSVQIPQCSYSSGKWNVNKNVLETIPTNLVIVDSMLAVIRAGGWKRVTLIYDLESLGWEGREYFASRASKMGIFVLSFVSLSSSKHSDDQTYSFIKERIHGTQSRIQVLFTTGFLQFDILREMRNSNLMDQNYVWITLNEIAATLSLEEGVEGYNGLIMVDNEYTLPGYEPYESFVNKWVNLNRTEYPGSGSHILNNNEAMAYSCVMMLAEVYAYHIRSEEEKGVPRERVLRDILLGEGTGNTRVPHYYGTNAYYGPAGPITLDLNGDRKTGPYIAQSMRNGKAVTFATINGGVYQLLRPPPFKSNYPTWPQDAPPGVIKNPKWSSAVGIIYGTLCIISILATLLSAIMVIRYREHIVIKASRALTIKNYRIYRIFNSVTVANQAFQTRLLLRFVFLAVLIAAAPMLAQVIIDTPEPTMLNIRAYQWVHCDGKQSQAWWIAAAGVVPLLLTFFGVFLAFKTRNVTYLWNEASQISLVLYNKFFFILIIVISQFFPMEIFTATFYISIIGIFFTAALALVVLFGPKFWNLWKAKYGRDTEDDDGSTFGMRNSRGRSGGLGKSTHRDNHFLQRTTPPISMRHGGSNVFGRAGGITASSPSAFTRTPVDLQSFPTQPIQGRRLSTLSTPSINVIPANDDPLREPSENVKENEQRDQENQTLDDAKPSSSISALAQRRRSTHSGADDWLQRVIPKLEERGDIQSPIDNPKFQDLRGTFIDSSDILALQNLQETAEASGASSSESTGPAARQSIDSQRRRGSTSAMASRLNDTPNAAQTWEQPHASPDPAPASGAQRFLGAYVFLLPIRFQKSRMATWLSHWSMATIILIPEAHAFLAVDSMSGKSGSYLMLSMQQVANEHSDGSEPFDDLGLAVFDENYEPLLRITTNTGTLLVRFTSQARFEGWMSLFSEEDLTELTPASLTGSQPAAVSTASRPDTSSYLRRISPGKTLTSRLPETNVWKHSAASDIIRHGDMMEQPGASASASTSAWPNSMAMSKQRSWDGRLSPQTSLRKTDSDVISEPRYSHSLTDLTNVYSHDGRHLPINEQQPRPQAYQEQEQHQQHQQQQQQREQSEEELLWATGADDSKRQPLIRLLPMKTQELGAQNIIPSATPTNDSGPLAPSDTSNLEPLQALTNPSNSFVLVDASRQSKQHQVQQQSAESAIISGTVPQRSSLSIPKEIDSEDDDEDDLYDPEFGIGGNGRRRNRRSNLGRLLAPDATRFQSSSSLSSSSSPSDSMSSTLTTPSAIPSAAVISAAAAAVAAGWNESDALAAAMANHELLLSRVTFNPESSSLSSSLNSASRRRIGSGHSLASSFRMSTSSTTRSSKSRQHSLFVSDLLSSGQSLDPRK
ncbi:hypothetical protein BGZ94_004579 [Podila epigama]|nr:hypothetical protein BGZ94_004579 [Podila epigama]